MADETDAATAQEPTADAPTLASVEAQAETLAQDVAALEHPAVLTPGISAPETGVSFDGGADPAQATVTNLDGSIPERGADGMIPAQPFVVPDGVVRGQLTPVAPGEPPDNVLVQSASTTGYKKVRYAAPADVDLPAEYAGRWWHANSEYVLSAAEVARVQDIRGFVVLGDAPAPAPEEPHRG